MNEASTYMYIQNIVAFYEEPWKECKKENYVIVIMRTYNWF